MPTTVQILGDEIASLPDSEIGEFADYLVQAHPSAANRLLAELTWGFMDLELEKESDNG